MMLPQLRQRLFRNSRDTLGEATKKQIIFEAETLAAVVAFALRKDDIKQTVPADNEGTKFSLLKGASENFTVDVLASLFAAMEVSVHSLTWISRVPSKSNIADGPSRNDFSSEPLRNATNLSGKANPLLAGLLVRLKEDGVKSLDTSQSVKRPKLH